MNFTKRWLSVGVATICFATSGLYAEDTVKVPKPERALKKIAKSLVKAKSYKLNFEVSGGTSKSKDHTINSVSVSQQYLGEHYRGITYFETQAAFRKTGRGKGAIRNASTKLWQSINATAEGTRLDRLMPLPDVLLVDALRVRSEVEWVEVEDEEEVVVEREGNTGVVKRVKKNAVHPTVLRVKLPQKESVKVFTEVVKNSNCVGGG